MRVVSLREEAKRIEARRRAFDIDDQRIAMARNKGAARTVAKRQLLQTFAEEARRQGRTPPFVMRALRRADLAGEAAAGLVGICAGEGRRLS